MFQIKQSTAITVPFFVMDSAGAGVTGIADGSFTKRISKAGAAFGAMTVTITELENGWYSIPLGTGHTDTLGFLAVSLSASGALRVNLLWNISARIFDDMAYPTTSGRSLDVSTTGEVGLDFDNIKDASGAHTLTNITVPTVTTTATATNLTNAPTSGDFTSTMKTSLNNATPAVTVSDKTGFSLSTAGILAIWHQLTSAIVTANTIGKLLLDNIDATISSRTKPADTQAAVTTVTNLTNAPSAGDFTATMKTSLNNATPAVTVSDKTGFSLSTAGILAIWHQLTSAIVTSSTIGKLLKDNIDATVSSRSTLDGSGVQSALTSQGYTSTRAGYLDTLNGLVANIWSYATRLLTAGTNIVLAKGTGVTGFNDVSSSDVQTAAGAALTAYDATKWTGQVESGMTDIFDAVNVIPTARDNADELLDRDMSAGPDTNARSPRNAFRALRNKVDTTTTPGKATVFKENDTTVAWTADLVTDPDAEPIVSVDP